MSKESVAVRVLLVSRDIGTIEFLCQHIQPMSMHVETACDSDSGIRKLCHSKFEGVIIDLALGQDAFTLLKKVRDLTSHRHAVICVVADTAEQSGEAFRACANFVFSRPLCGPSVVRTLRASYPMMFRERRRTYRYPIEVATIVEGDGNSIAAQSVNISETGMALQSSARFAPGSRIRLQLTLPGIATPVNASGEVCWADETGRAGIRFERLPSGITEVLQTWLSERMAEVVPVH
jgi:DNA-binding NtrC family response regulator